MSHHTPHHHVHPHQPHQPHPHPHSHPGSPILSPGSASSAAAASPSGASASPIDERDERDTENLRSALSSGDKPLMLDVATLLAHPDKLKKACRAGLPMQQRRDLWQGIVSLHTTPAAPGAAEAYLASKLEVFNGLAHPTHFPHIPDYGSMMKWNETYIHLTHKRINHAKTILCVLACNHPTLSHCPLLPDLVCVLLIFLDEAGCYSFVERMLNRSKSDGFYCTTNGIDFLRWMKTFSILLESKNAALYNHMHKTLHLDSAKLFQAWLNRLFIQYLPMRTVFRILDCYLMEGNKILFRVGLGVLKLHTKALLACKTQKSFLAKLHALMVVQTPGPLLETGFEIYLSRTNHIGKIATHIDEHSHTLLTNPPASDTAGQGFHLPRFTREQDHVSEIIGIEELYSLWAWLPSAQRICDPVLLYSSTLHGYNYSTMWHRSCGSEIGENTAIFFLFRSVAEPGAEAKVIGLFLNKPLPDSKDVIRRKGKIGGVTLGSGTGSGNSSNISAATTTTEPLDTHSFLFQLSPKPGQCWRHFVMEREQSSKHRSYKEKQSRLWTEDVERSHGASVSSLSDKSKGLSIDTTPGLLHVPKHVRGPSADALGGVAGSNEIFEPYGLSRADHGDHGLATEDAALMSALRISVEPHTPGTASTTSTDSTVSDEQSLKAMQMQQRQYTNTIGPMFQHHAPASHFLPLAGGGVADRRATSHTVLLQPSGGVSKNLPLKELFADLSTSPPPTTLDSPVATQYAAKLAASPDVPAHRALSGGGGEASSRSAASSVSSSSSSSGASLAVPIAPLDLPPSALTVAARDSVNDREFAPTRTRSSLIASRRRRGDTRRGERGPPWLLRRRSWLPRRPPGLAGCLPRLRAVHSPPIMLTTMHHRLQRRQPRREGRLCMAMSRRLLWLDRRSRGPRRRSRMLRQLLLRHLPLLLLRLLPPQMAPLLPPLMLFPPVTRCC